MQSSQKKDDMHGIRKTKFTMLKDEQYSLNMQMRLAMQLHDEQAQTDLEKELKEVTDQIGQLNYKKHEKESKENSVICKT